MWRFANAYQTINKEDFKTYARESFFANSFTSTGYTSSEWADTYVDYVVRNKIMTKGSATILPEMFWTNHLNQSIVSAWVNLEVIGHDLSDNSLMFQDFGSFPSRSIPLPSTKIATVYEGLVQFRMIGDKIDYMTNSVIRQIHPSSNGFGGALSK